MNAFKVETAPQLPETIEKAVAGCPLLGEAERSNLLSDISEMLSKARYYREHHEFPA